MLVISVVILDLIPFGFINCEQIQALNPETVDTEHYVEQLLGPNSEKRSTSVVSR